MHIEKIVNPEMCKKVLKEFTEFHLMKVIDVEPLTNDEEGELKRLQKLGLTWSENYKKIFFKLSLFRENEANKERNRILLSLKENYGDYNFIISEVFSDLVKKYKLYAIGTNDYRGLFPEEVISEIENNKDFIEADLNAKFHKECSELNCYMLASNFEELVNYPDKEKEENYLNLNFLYKILVIEGYEFMVIIKHW